MILKRIKGQGDITLNYKNNYMKFQIRIYQKNLHTDHYYRHYCFVEISIFEDRIIYERYYLDNTTISKLIKYHILSIIKYTREYNGIYKDI